MFALAAALGRIKMSNQYSAACLCGIVRVDIDGVFESFYLCHCDHCRKGTGSAHAANLFSSKATLSWTSGRDKTVDFYAARHEAHQVFLFNLRLGASVFDSMGNRCSCWLP